MLRFRHMLLALPALALFLASAPAHATVSVTDNQVKPVAYGPGASDDHIGYTCTSDNSSPFAAYRIWYPGYTPTSSEDKSADGHYNDFTDSNAISNDGLPHGFDIKDIFAKFYARYVNFKDGDFCYYDVRIAYYHPVNGVSTLFNTWAPMMHYTAGAIY